jgi:UDP-glucose 4-epimerase
MKRILNKNNKENYEVFNIGTGSGSTVLEVISSFEKVSKKSLNYKIVGRREGDIISAYADTTKANKELNWKAESSLDQAMKSAWDWEIKIRS